MRNSPYDLSSGNKGFKALVPKKVSIKHPKNESPYDLSVGLKGFKLLKEIDRQQKES